MNKYLEKLASQIDIKPSHQGALHHSLGVPEGEHLTDAELEAAKAHAKETGNTQLMRRVVFAQNARKWHHK